jgi:hypothetical protein
LFTFAIYWITLSPDVSFWDAGEFIATSHSLGIPHPPGTPLYVLMGRVFSILFHSVLHVASPAVAVNLLSAIPSAIAAVFLHLCVVRVGKKMWNGGDQVGYCLPAVVAGVTAALFAAFASTLWINSIEAEVYAVSGMWAVFTAWLILLWADSEPKDERLLVVIAYLLALNIGVHLATYLAALALLPFAFLHERRLAIPVSFVVVLTLAKDIQFFLLIVALLLLPTLQFALLPKRYGQQHRAVLMMGHAVAIVLALMAVGLDPSLLRNVLLYGGPVVAFAVPWLFLKPPNRVENPMNDLGFLLALVTVLGVSCHLYLPIRSALNPPINEAQPDTWQGFWDVLLRAQYRPVSVFERQATWVYQFDHMFWRYFREQWKPEFLWWLLGIPGLVAHLRREKRTFVLFGLLFFWTSAVLVVKMNFTDHEVRERDYFFAPGFFYFAVWMGLGLGWLTHVVQSGVDGARRVAFGGLAAVLSLVISAWPIRGHWETHDRRGNWIAYDYARNMLIALEPDAIIFTNGDNDTFPLWYLQEVGGIRTDVRVVNLSLLNTPWYAEQLRNETPHGSLRVPMGYATEQLKSLRPYRDRHGEVHLVKDQVAMNIVNTVYEQGNERPVYFAVTVDDLLELEDYLKLEGLVFRLTPDDPRGSEPAIDAPGTEPSGDVPPPPEAEIADNVNLAVTRRNLEEVYDYRGVLDEQGSLDDEVYRNPNETKLVTNYAAAWARMALAYRSRRQWDEAVACLENATRIAPHYDPIAGGMGTMYIEAGRLDKAREFYLARQETHPHDVRNHLGLAYIAERSDEREEALEWYLRAARLEPSAREILVGLYRTYMGLGRYEEAENVLERWLQVYPNDQSARKILDELRSARQNGIDPGLPGVEGAEVLPREETP